MAICGAFGGSISREMTRQSRTNGNTVKLLKKKESDVRYPSIFASPGSGDCGGFLAPKALSRSAFSTAIPTASRRRLFVAPATRTRFDPLRFLVP